MATTDYTITTTQDNQLTMEKGGCILGVDPGWMMILKASEMSLEIKRCKYKRSCSMQCRKHFYSCTKTFL